MNGDGKKKTNTTLWSTGDVARNYRVSCITVRRWAARGAPVLRLPGELRFEPEILAAWLIAGFPSDSNSA